jgi:hypothetical protein
VPFEQIANVIVCERETAMIVLLEKLQIVFNRSVTLSLPIDQGIKHDEVSLLYLTPQLRASSLLFQIIFKDQGIKKEFPQLEMGVFAHASIEQIAISRVSRALIFLISKLSLHKSCKIGIFRHQE